jgi:hypothetical protein
MQSIIYSCVPLAKIRKNGKHLYFDIFTQNPGPKTFFIEVVSLSYFLNDMYTLTHIYELNCR